MGKKKAMWTGCFFTAFNLFNYGTMALIIALGAIFYLDGRLAIGDITNFLLQIF